MESGLGGGKTGGVFKRFAGNAALFGRLDAAFCGYVLKTVFTVNFLGGIYVQRF
ncbi:MAG: hypothetical protein LBC53_05680 [Spirochaetaceae bacterium]|jgi:hypothetical protein|nr:hypothetical protein [Spirochaetaceae bacterium]